jgi:hypothetical protein
VRIDDSGEKDRAACPSHVLVSPVSALEEMNRDDRVVIRLERLVRTDPTSPARSRRRRRRAGCATRTAAGRGSPTRPAASRGGDAVSGGPGRISPLII